MVIRSRFFSTMYDPENVDELPPPSALDNPPPFPEWSSTDIISPSDTITWITIIIIFTTVITR